jgi:mono/diheme cytochrome c family protein
MHLNFRPTRAWRALALVSCAASCDAPADTGARADAAPPPPMAALPSAAFAGLDGTERMAALGCGACHAGLGAPPTTIVLATAAGPRDPAALFAFLSDSLPTPPRADGARMPDFHLTDAEALALALYLGRGRSAREARAAFERARDAHPDVEADDGARVYAALRCGACHAAADERPGADAPSLAAEGTRVRDEWLRAFLRRPHAVRPFGTRPGSGARMPDFGLADDDVAAIATTLLAGATTLPAFEPDAPSAFAAAKVDTLLRVRYDCLGCHALDDEGGRIAPDLGRVAERLQPAYIRAMLDDPARLVPRTMMPRLRLQRAEVDALAHFLATRAPGAPSATAARAPAALPTTTARAPSGVGSPRTEALVGAGAYLSPLEHALVPAARGDDGAAVYARRCAACHGAEGRGDGYNAAFLPVAPTAHADADSMARRPDDTLHDGIAAGARILGKSARMPAFGASLSPAEIRSLVTHIRTLCDCAPPAWSVDGAR